MIDIFSRRALVLAFLSLAACGSDDPAPTPGGLELPLAPDPMSADHPFPTSRHLEGDHLRVPGWVLDPGLPAGAARAHAVFAALGEQLAELSGVGVTAPLFVPVRGAIDATSIDGAVVVMDVAGGEPAEIDVTLVDDRLEIRPVVAWREGHRYAVVVSGLRTPSGEPCRPSEGMRDRLEAELVPLVDDSVCVAFSFPVQALAPQVDALREALANHALASPPQATIETVLDALEVEGLQESQFVEKVAYGTFLAPEWRDEDGLFVPERLTGEAPMVPLRFAVSLPRIRNKKEPVPLVIGLHGMGGEIDNTLPIYAELLGEHGFAYATIDGVAHGSRSLGGQPQLEIFKLSDLRFTRDAFRQTLSDLYRFRQSMAAGVVIDRVPIAQTGIRWTGGSYGGIFGVMMSAFDEELEAAHVEGCGGPWSTILADSNMNEVVKLVFAGHAELGKADHALVDRAVQRFLELGQWLFDAGDPVGLAHQLSGRAQRPRMLMQYWVGEPVMPNTASVRLERAIGLPQNKAAQDGAGVWGVWSYDLEAWGVTPGNDDAHQAYWKIPEARAQAIQFLVSHGTEIHEPGG